MSKSKPDKPLDRSKWSIRIAPTLALPLEMFTLKQLIIGKSRVGKSYKASVEAEELLKAKMQVVIMDPTGAWYGLRSSADGKSPGFPITIFGGDHADLELLPSAGAELAQAIATEHFSAIIDLTAFSKGEDLRFCADFLDTLYRKNRTPLHLFLDEADFYAPQQPQGDEMRTLGACQTIVRRGGLRGIGITMITQRSAVLNKSVLTMADVLTVLRMDHPKDLAPIRDWVGVHGDIEMSKQMFADLPTLPKGDAWIWSPSNDIFERVTFRDRETFDSGRSPKPGEGVRTPKVLAPVDLERLGASMARTAEQAKANDPKALKAEVARLKKANEVLEAGVERSIKTQLGKVATKTVEKRVMKDGQIKRVELMIAAGEKLIDRWNNVSADAHEALDTLRGRATEAFTCLGIELAGIRLAIASTKEPAPAPQQPPKAFLYPGGHTTHPAQRAPFVKPKPVADRHSDGAGNGFSKVERLMMTALAQHPDGLTRKQVLIFSGYRHSGTTTKAFAQLIAEDHVENSRGMLVATSRGLTTLGPYEALPLGDELRARLLNGNSDLPEVEKTILGRASEVYPDAIDRTTARGDYAHSGTTTKAFARLIAMGYLIKTRGGVTAAHELFG